MSTGLGERRGDLAATARLLQRATFGPFPGGTEAALEAGGTPDGVIDALVAAEPVPFVPPHDIDIPVDLKLIDVLGSTQLVQWWVRRMASDEAGLHEKMMWFWHGHFTTSASKANFFFLWHQLRTIHAHALGNVRDLAKAMVVDPAMLMWLDGNGSKIESPNENLGRELMELFTLGIGHYTEADVRAAARSLSGWENDWTTDRAVFDPADGPSRPDTFLGRREVYDPDRLVDQILAQPAAAPFLVGRLWRFFIGGRPDATLVARWARLLRSGDYEIAPVVEAMLRSNAFADRANVRPRRGLEWAVATLRTLGVDLDSFNAALLDGLGQTPYDPPNVAGWADDTAWTSAASMYARAAFIEQLMSSPTPPTALTSGTGDPVDDALRRCALYDVSMSTRRGLGALADALKDEGTQRRMAVLQAALLCPEFAVA